MTKGVCVVACSKEKRVMVMEVSWLRPEKKKDKSDGVKFPLRERTRMTKKFVFKITNNLINNNNK